MISAQQFHSPKDILVYIRTELYNTALQEYSMSNQIIFHKIEIEKEVKKKNNNNN